MIGSRDSIIRTVALVVVVGMASFASYGGRLALAPGDPAPEVRGNTAQGERKVIDFSKSAFTLLNFWATWCEPCKLEMPVLERLHREHAADELQIIGVMHDSADDEAMQQFLDSLEITFTSLRPVRRSIEAYGGIGVLPTTILVDREGLVRRRYVGATAPQIDGLVVDVEDALAGRPLQPMVMPEESNALAPPRTR